MTLEILYEPRPDYAACPPDDSSRVGRSVCGVRSAAGPLCPPQRRAAQGDGRSVTPRTGCTGCAPESGSIWRSPTAEEGPAMRAAARGGGPTPGRAIRPLVAGLGGSLHLPRTVPRRRRSERAGAEADGLCAVGRGRRGAHDLAAGADRRRPQLGLPLLLAARCVVHAARPVRPGLRRGGDGLSGLDAARHAADLARAAGAVRRLRRGAPARARAAAPPRLRRLPPVRIGNEAQRSAPARRLRRGRRRRGAVRAPGRALRSRDAACSTASATRSASAGASPTKGSGRGAPVASTTPIRRRCAGSRSTA